MTEQRSAREALRRNEERWRALIDKGADVITISDRDGTIRFASPSIETVCGYTVEEFVGKSPFEEGYIHPEDIERCERAFRELENNPGHSVSIQHRYRHGSGGWRWLEGTFTNFFDDPTIGGLVANFRDITERKGAEEALRESEERLRTFLAGAPVIAFALDHEGTFVLSAGRGLSALGLEQNEVVGRSVFDVYAGEVELHEDLRRALGGEVFTAIREVSGLTFETRYSPLRGLDGEVTGVIGVATDITERKKAEEERGRLLAREWVARAEAAERERISRELHDRVAHSMAVAHQSLQLHEVIKDRDPSAAAAKLGLAREMTRTALESTRNLSMELRRSEAEEGLEGALRDLLKVAVPSGVRAGLRVEGEESLVSGRARGQLFLILREAVLNATSHSECRHVTVGLRIDGSRSLGSVEDDGRGFDPDGDYFSGVGLSSMRERAQLLGGELTVRSVPGDGTRVEVFLPLARGGGSG